MWNNGRVNDGLYRLVGGFILKSHASISDSDSPHHQIIQRHRRLRHPSFYVLEKRYPYLFKQCNVETLVCHTCELAKYTELYILPLIIKVQTRL